MNSKRLYITPLINRIVIDKTISVAMLSINNDDPPPDPWGAPPTPPPSGSGVNDSPPSQFNKPIVPNSFDDNPFK